MLRRLIKPLLFGLFTLFSLLLSNHAFCENTLSWDDFIAKLRKEALADHIRPEIFDKAFAGMHAPSARVLHFDKTQPEKRLSFLTYRNSRIDHYRILLGRKELKRHQSALNKIKQQYGVSPCFILSIWGLETSYGRYKGDFPVMQSLATLTYDPRRSEFFHNELRNALRMLNDGDVQLQDFKGEWAGASGHCQFLPSTYMKYAASYNGHDKPDIWNNPHDAFASIANFLVQNGWHKNEPVAIEVTIPDDFDESYISTNATKTVEEWLTLGVQINSDELPDGNLEASIIYPDGGPAYMTFNNFKILLQWNRSNYYVGALGYLAEEICQK